MATKKTAVKTKTTGGSKALVIVESPTKQKTISKILGDGFTVKSSFGHVRDLPEKELGVDEEHDFKPVYAVIEKAKKNVTELKQAAAKASEIYLATDPDREGESIAWHLVQILNPKPEQVHRISFHEITAAAVRGSLENARQIDTSLVEAQQARRVLDRLVGYKLSPLLWKKVGKGLSAGRVQSAAVRIIVERGKEIENFKQEEFWSLSALLEKAGAQPQFNARLVAWQGQPVEKTTTYKLFAEDYRVKTTIFIKPEDVTAAAELLRKSKLTVAKLESKEVRQKPKPPFITSSLQQDAYNKLGFTSQRTMKVAQSLYEGVAIGEQEIGLITYMRTDSFNVSKEIQAESREFIVKEYGKEFLPESAPLYTTKVKGAQEAHEAIHPTSVGRKPEDIKQYLSADQAKLYELIWRRFMASQMESALYQSVSAEIAAGDPAAPEAMLRAGGRTLKFAGYLKVYQEEAEETDVEEEGLLPQLAEGDTVKLLDIEQKPHKTSPPPAYNEASLIKTMEKHGIGRPSTYAPIIKTIIDRKYIAQQAKSGKLAPTQLGITVTDKLKDFFSEIMDLSYTAEVEEKLDGVAEGQQDWVKVVREFYTPFTKDLDSAYSTMQAAQPKQSDEKCPLCGSPMLIRESRFGKYLSCSKFPKCKGKMRLDSEGHKVEPEKTNEICKLCGKPMVIRMGRRGKFLACSGFPACKNTISIDAQGNKIAGSGPIMTERKCEKCSSPLALRRGPRGYFLACSAYPKCRNIIKVTDEEVKEIQEKHAKQQKESEGK